MSSDEKKATPEADKKTKDRKKKGHGKSTPTEAVEVAEEGAVALPPPTLDVSVNNELVQDIAKKLQVHLQASTSATAARDMIEAKTHNYETWKRIMPDHQFWTTQPVPQLTESSSENAPIKEVDVSQVRNEPYSLPEQFVWNDVDVQDEAQLTELYTLLRENYVEDDEAMFRFAYSPRFLQWALMPPGWLKEWHCGVRAANGKLLAFISAVPARVRIYDKEVKLVEINFLCVHKKLRSKRVAPVLIREITRRCNLHGIFQATFTAGIIIPKPIGTCRYWHRSLNPKKLIETRFSQLEKNMTMARTIKRYKLPEEVKSIGLKPLEPRHVESACALLNNHLKQFDLVPLFDVHDFKHFFLPQSDVIYSYVIEAEGEESSEVTDLLSFYCLPSTVVNHATHKEIKAAYSFYNAATTVPLAQLMNDGLILARKEEFDVFNALDLMENGAILKELHFGIGDGNLQYYFFNWKCPDLEPGRIGLVLQ